jgi:hypothetical protein
VAIALTFILGVLTIVAALAILSGHASSAIAFTAHQIVGRPGSIRVVPPGPGRIVLPGPLGPFVGTQISGIGLDPLALLLLIVGVVGLALLGVLYWRPWSGSRRFRHQRGGGTPGWN